jgi:Sporulation and spore germination
MTAEPPAPPPPEPSARPASRRLRWVVGGVGLAALVAGVWVVSTRLPRWLETSRVAPPASQPTPPSAPEEARKIRATLFYVSDDGSGLLPVSAEVAYGATPVEQARQILEAQIHPPPSRYVSAIPAGTTLRTLYLTTNGEAYADFSKEIVTGHTGGSLDEALTVYTIVNALTVNLPSVTAVQILVDGRGVDTLVGHLDLRHPLARALKWVKKGT